MPPLSVRFLAGSPRLILGILLLLALFALSALHTPDPTSSSFQFPAFLPSRYPPTRHIAHPQLNLRLERAATLLAETCPGPLEPIYVDPGLTPSQEKRYDHLRHATPSPNGRGIKRILVATTLRQIHDQLPDLLNTLIVLVTFLGPARLVFSIVEGPSDDCTALAFEKVLGPTLLSLGIPANRLHLITGEKSIDFNSHNRIEVLANLRNRALLPLFSAAGRQEEWEAVVMLNDVFLRARDILELLHQHKLSGAGMTTGIDWWKRHPAYYYDVWVGRTIDTGELFYPISGTSWSPSSDLFHDSPTSKTAYDHLEPFQVYSSWNGMAILDPRPFLPPHNVRFRKGDSKKGECTASECSLLAQDFWAKGFGRIQVVPSVQLAYEVQSAKETRDELHTTQARLSWNDGVPMEEHDKQVSWESKPPAKVRCHPWPDANGKDFNVWEKTLWVNPLTGVPVK